MAIPNRQGSQGMNRPVLSHVLSRIPRGERVLPLLLGALVVLIFVSAPLADMELIRRPLLGMMMVVVVLSGVLTLGGQGRLYRPILALGLLLFGIETYAAAAGRSSALTMTAEVVATLFLILLCARLLLRVFSRGRMTVRRLMGAVIVYLLAAIIFAIFFDATERLAPGAFNLGPDPSPTAPHGVRFFYLSVITLTSVGFGDLTPLHPIARSLVMLEALLGQIYMTVVLGWLVSLQIAHQPAELDKD
jgi:D-alanyl-lipoteichoic acid acyltransferase DltB (MBOAT superfamily)